MPIEAGQQLLHYRLIEKVGEGGMGVVWKATDTTLDREVAIKILPDAFAKDKDRLARFQREAKLLASLNHANIATVHSVHEADGLRFLAMEFVGGEDLAQRLARGAIPVDESLKIAAQIAEALEAAHEAGVIHRDLKPANIKFTLGDRVKVLDFGLAKAFAAEAPAQTVDTNPSMSPTRTSGGTVAGAILGSPSYMSPEQAQGKPIDKRTDIWAFGCVLYEMLCGGRPFAGDTVTDVLAAIIKEEPEFDRLPALPPVVERTLRRCLVKDPRRRLRDVGEARIALDPTETAEASTEPHARGIPRWAVGSAALVLGLLAGLLWNSSRQKAGREIAVSHFPLATPDSVQLSYDHWPGMAISPDGRRIVFAGMQGGRRHLFLQELDQGGPAQPIRGTEGADSPFLSPDGKRLGFLTGGRLKTVALKGGQPLDLAPVGRSHLGACWAFDGNIYFVPQFTSGVFRIPAEGGTAEEIAARFERKGSYPELLPSGTHLLYTVGGNPPRVALLSLATGEETTLYEHGFYARYVATGHILFAQADTLMAMPFDLETLEAGEPAPVVEGIRTHRGELFADFAVSQTGSLVYLDGASERERWLVRLAPDREAERLNSTPAPFDYLPIDLSPDDKHIAMSLNSEVWIFDVERHDLGVRLTESGYHPVWTPDGSTTTYIGDRELWSRPAAGGGEPELLVTGPGGRWPGAWSRDGSAFIYTEEHPETILDLWVYTTADPDTPRHFLHSPDNEWFPSFSPDGRWVVYSSDESGQWEVYVISYPEARTKHKVSTDGGSSPRWTADGSRIFYQWNDQVMVAEVSDSAAFSTSPPKRFVRGVDAGAAIGGTWDVAGDASYVVALEQRRAPRLNLVLGWFDELRERVPGR